MRRYDDVRHEERDRENTKRRSHSFSTTHISDINLIPSLSATEVIDMKSAYDRHELSVQRNYEHRCCKLDSAK